MPISDTTSSKQRYEVTGSYQGALFITGAGGYLNNYFTTNSMDVANESSSEQVTRVVGRHNRKRYPGDTGHAVREHNRRTDSQAAKGGGGAAPGERFWCERPTGEGENRRSNARQFIYEGNWNSLKLFARANGVGAPFTLRNASGKSILVTPD